MQSWSMAVIAHRLRRAGFNPLLFSYRSVRDSLADAAARLAEFIEALNVPPLHFVGYSLGGLVLRALCAQTPFDPGARVVTIGTPHAGSIAAAALARWPGGPQLLGRAMGDVRRALPRLWAPCDGAWGTIIGARSLGLGRIVARFAGANDGTVGVQEAQLPWASASVVLPVSHMEMLVSAAVAQQTAHFLHRGVFAPRAGV